MGVFNNCTHEDSSFDRCIEEDGSMHYYCNYCGLRDTDWEDNMKQVSESIIIPRTNSDEDTNIQEGINLDGQIFKEGIKKDEGKPRWELIAYDAIEGIVKVLTFGASKYNARNWEKGISYGRVFGAIMRHLWKWWQGESKDPETGLSHLDHAACEIMFLSAYEKRNMTKFDDRPGV